MSVLWELILNGNGNGFVVVFGQGFFGYSASQIYHFDIYKFNWAMGTSPGVIRNFCMYINIKTCHAKE